MSSRSPVATDATTIFTDLEAVAFRARERAEAELEQPESTEELPAGESAAAVVSRAVREVRGAVLGHGAAGLEKLAKDPDADLSEQEQFGVEAIVLLEGRPLSPSKGVTSGTRPRSGRPRPSACRHQGVDHPGRQDRRDGPPRPGLDRNRVPGRGRCSHDQPPRRRGVRPP